MIEITNIKFMLMKRIEIVNEFQSEFLKTKSVNFSSPGVLNYNEEELEQLYMSLCKDMYNDLIKDAPDDMDYIGIIINSNSNTINNSISRETIKDIEAYSIDDINIGYELLLMTLKSNKDV